MTKRGRVVASLLRGWALGALAAPLVALAVVAVPRPAWAQVSCTPTVTNPTGDADNDGFTNAQECAGITTRAQSGTNARRFERCATGLARANCVDPNSKDVFVIYKPVAAGSLLSGLQNPFGDNTFYGIVFRGLSALGVTVHQVTSTEVHTDRTIVTGSPQKAVKISESLDTNGDSPPGTLPVGYCPFGKPSTGICTVHTQRVMNLINARCDAAGDTAVSPVPTDRNQVFLAYATYIILHEVGHAIGGLRATYHAEFGGNHYSPMADYVMSQSAQYSTVGGRCIWYMSPIWNPVDDPSAVRLK